MRSIVLSCILILSAGQVLAADTSFTVHEWGTFTSLQDEAGRTIGGINSDDESVPKFVHNLLPLSLVGNAEAQSVNQNQQGWPRASLPVTMRLETPVLYVYPRPGFANQKLDISVEFHGGWLTQFYPNAMATPTPSTGSPITDTTMGRLDWRGVAVGGNGKIPETNERVWLAPRGPESGLLTSFDGETEKYLFYRGVGHVEAPLKVTRTGSDVKIQTQQTSSTRLDRSLVFSSIWFCDFREDGQCAWRRLNEVRAGSPGVVDGAFALSEYSKENLTGLQKEMQAALESAGLYQSEAEAMLSTWELSYFKSWGTRVFYIVPVEWTAKILPLSISPKPTDLHRVMVGRIDLVTDRHRELLKKLSNAMDVKAQDAELWKAYDALGRFRNSLVIDEQKRTNSPALTSFMNAHGLQPAAQQ